MTNDKTRKTGTLRLPANRIRRLPQAEHDPKPALAVQWRDVEQSAVKEENRIWSMKH